VWGIRGERNECPNHSCYGIMTVRVQVQEDKGEGGGVWTGGHLNLL
jgi:hypothetical protein